MFEGIASSASPIRLFAFLRDDGVEPTNNVAERTLRCAVQWRKITFESRSADGEVAVAPPLPATCTCRMQNRAPLDYLVNEGAIPQGRFNP
jgi:transposase